MHTVVRPLFNPLAKQIGSVIAIAFYVLMERWRMRYSMILIAILGAQFVSAQEHSLAEGLKSRPPLVGAMSKSYTCPDGNKFTVVMIDKVEQEIEGERFHELFNFCPSELANSPLECARAGQSLSDTDKNCLQELENQKKLFHPYCEGGIVTHCTDTLWVSEDLE